MGLRALFSLSHCIYFPCSGSPSLPRLFWGRLFIQPPLPGRFCPLGGAGGTGPARTRRARLCQGCHKHQRRARPGILIEIAVPCAQISPALRDSGGTRTRPGSSNPFGCPDPSPRPGTALPAPQRQRWDKLGGNWELSQHRQGSAASPPLRQELGGPRSLSALIRRGRSLM